MVKAMDSQSIGPGLKTTGWIDVRLSLPRSIKWVLGIPVDLVVKSKLFPRSDPIALRQLNPI